MTSLAEASLYVANVQLNYWGIQCVCLIGIRLWTRQNGSPKRLEKNGAGEGLGLFRRGYPETVTVAIGRFIRNPIGSANNKIHSKSAPKNRLGILVLHLGQQLVDQFDGERGRCFLLPRFFRGHCVGHGTSLSVLFHDPGHTKILTGSDQETGFIYILSSLSPDIEIRSIKDLFKIGFSTLAVEDRIKNAAQEPTYLMAEVKIVTAFRCYNLNTQKLEFMLHAFFGNSCLDIDVFDKAGKRHSPREWFIAPLNIIEAAIQLVINGEIIHYKYDSATKEIVQR